MKYCKLNWMLMASMMVTGLVIGVTPVYSAEKGMLLILTEPGDAKIYINGKRKGNSPAKAGQFFAIKLKEGEYKVEAYKLIGGGMELYGVKTDVFVAGDSKQAITLELIKQYSKEGRKLAKKKQIPNSTFTPLKSKRVCYSNLAINKSSEHFTCGDNRGSTTWIFDKQGNHIDSINGNTSGFIEYISDNELIVNDDYGHSAPKLIKENGETILEYKSFKSSNGGGGDLVDDIVLLNKDWSSYAWIRELRTGKLLFKIDIPDEFDRMDGAFRISHDKTEIAFGSSRHVLIYNMNGSLNKTIPISDFGKKYISQKWSIEGVDYINTNKLIAYIYNGTNDALDVVLSKNNVITGIKQPSYRPPSVGKTKIAVNNNNIVSIYDLSGRWVGNLNRKLLDPGNTCEIYFVKINENSNTVLTRCGIWTF